MNIPLYRPSRRTALALLGAAFAAPSVSFAGSVETHSGPAFGTYWQIMAPSGSGVARLVPDIQALFAKIDTELSPWRGDSAISRFNHGTAGTHNPAVLKVTAAALDIARRSEGAFDPTVGPLVAQWGFGPVTQGGTPDWRALSVGPGMLTKARADLTLDLCGIAKGWALDSAAALARDAGFDSLLIDLGGELYALGHHPDGRDWHVAIEAPSPMFASPAALRLPAGAAVATSGTRAQSYELNGRIYSHIMDPATRAPAAGALRSVTVVAADAMTADGWATALCAAGHRAGPDLATSQDIAAVFLIERDGGLRTVRTGQIAQFIL
ncbi:FAD:protein FMN transferase [Yoonia algicola]|uniref:FAD:protein FMN transferase n=1 Tax=Yoonia algicola TaxID=3137368 RepID=A0AAN0NII8_9RHOB